jgi:hypothetical protein
MNPWFFTRQFIEAILFSAMYAPVVLLGFGCVAFVGKKRADKFQCADAERERKQDYDCEREPLSRVGPERIVCEPVHKNVPQSHCLCGPWLIGVLLGNPSCSKSSP